MSYLLDGNSFLFIDGDDVMMKIWWWYDDDNDDDGADFSYTCEHNSKFYAALCYSLRPRL